MIILALIITILLVILFPIPWIMFLLDVYKPKPDRIKKLQKRLDNWR